MRVFFCIAVYAVHASKLEFSSPSLIAVSTPAEVAQFLPWVPEHFFSLARPDNNASSMPLLFGAHGPSSWDFSRDGGASWSAEAASVPFYGSGSAMQINQLVPLYSAAGLFAQPVAYHDLGSVHDEMTAGGWSRSNVTTVRAAAGGGGLETTSDARARTTFSGVPAPGLNTTYNAVHPTPKVYGFLRLAGGGYVCVAALVWAGEAPRHSPDGDLWPTSMLAFVSSDSYDWRFAGIVANFSSLPGLYIGPNESDLGYLPDGKTLVAVMRMDGHDDCASGTYRYYYAAYSADGGSTWTRPAPLPGVGCVRPKLLLVPGAPLILSAGRNCVDGTRDNRLWTAAAEAPGANATEYSLSYQHNRLWRGNASFLFNASVNGTKLWETQSYTSLALTGENSFAIFYQKFMEPTFWGSTASANFVMHVTVAPGP